MLPRPPTPTLIPYSTLVLSFEASEPQLGTPPKVLEHWQRLRSQQAEEALRNATHAKVGAQAKTPRNH